MDNDSTNFLKTVSLCRVCLCKYVLPFQPLHPLRRRFVPCQVGFANGSPSGSRSKTHSRKPIWKSEFSSAMYLLKDQAPQIRVKSSPRLLGCRSLPLRHLGSLRSTMIKHVFWERIEAPLPPLRPRPKCDFIHPRQLSPFPERLVLPFSNEVVLSGYEELDSSGNDLFTSWAKLSEREILAGI